MGSRQNHTVNHKENLHQPTELEQAARVKELALLRDRAYQYLTRREYSLYELRQKLKPKDQFEQLELLLKELIQQNAQSDQRFAKQLGRARVNSGKGSILLEQELNQHRIDPIIIESTMDDYAGEWKQLAENARVKKFGPDLPTDYKEWARQARFLQQRGFTVSDIPDYRG
ncbi:MAG: regulatory protein RecX [bacterium]